MKRAGGNTPISKASIFGHLHSYAVWPGMRVIAFFVFTYTGLDACLWFLHRLYFSDLADPALATFAIMRKVVIAGSTAMYAMYRLARFHPACNQAYGFWLKQTPWTAAKPLPLGPANPVWQDLVFLGALAGLGWWDARLSPLWVFAAFGFFYLLGMTILLASTRVLAHCLMLGFLWPTILLPSMRGLPIFIVVAIMFNVAWLGYQKSLRAFPWPFLSPQNRAQPLTNFANRQLELRIPGLSDNVGSIGRTQIGWPFSRLAPKLDYVSVSLRGCFCWSLLMAWWLYCLSRGLEIPTLPEGLVAFAIIGALIRTAIYRSGVMPPFSVPARIASGRLILPGFDRVYVTPIITIISGILGAALVRRAGSQALLAESCFFGILWFILLSGRPTLKNWLLTGYHRFGVPRLAASRQMHRPI
jgi:hypothetical protein